jgi:hypothetical protein
MTRSMTLRVLTVFSLGFLTGCTLCRGTASVVATRARVVLGVKREAERRPVRWRFDGPLNGKEYR